MTMTLMAFGMMPVCLRFEEFHNVLHVCCSSETEDLKNYADDFLHLLTTIEPPNKT